MKQYGRILLAAARALIESEREQFICCAIEEANSKRSGGASYDKRLTVSGLKGEIQDAIEGKFTLEVYLYEKYGIRYERTDGKLDYWDEMYIPGAEIVYLERGKYDTFLRQARLAWIDRMLDNDEVR